jgi:hypothetical protein
MQCYLHDCAFTVKINALWIIHGHAFEFLDGNCLLCAVTVADHSHAHFTVKTLRNNE